jgi:hypothetical protein
MKKNKTLAIIFILLAVSAVVLYLVKSGLLKMPGKKKDNAQEGMVGNAAGSNVTPSQSGPAQPKSSSPFPLHFGSRGNEVKNLQKIVNVKADGVWGKNTGSAIFKQLGLSIVSVNEYNYILKQNRY